MSTDGMYIQYLLYIHLYSIQKIYIYITIKGFKPSIKKNPQ